MCSVSSYTHLMTTSACSCITMSRSLLMLFAHNPTNIQVRIAVFRVKLACCFPNLILSCWGWRWANNLCYLKQYNASYLSDNNATDFSPSVWDSHTFQICHWKQSFSLKSTTHSHAVARAQWHMVCACAPDVYLKLMNKSFFKRIYNLYPCNISLNRSKWFVQNEPASS